MRVRRRSLLAAVAAALTLAVGTSTVSASTPDDGASVTPEALVAAAELSAATSSRYEMYIEMSGIPGMPAMGSEDTPLATGAISATSATARLDLSVMIGGALPLADDDLVMETITIGQDVYVRAPYFAALAEISGGPTGPLGDFADLADRWAYVDGTALAADAGDLGSLLGASTGSPTALFGALGTTTKTAPIGSETIHGVPSSGVRAMVDFATIAQAQNVDPSILPPDLGATGDLEIPIEVWLGDNGHITRLVIEMDSDVLATAAEQSGAPDSLDLSAISGVSSTMTMESFDFGAADIVIEAPTEFVDMTQQFGDLLAEAQQGA